MSELTLEEFKQETIADAISYFEVDGNLQKALEYVFKQALIRGAWAESKGIIE